MAAMIQLNTSISTLNKYNFSIGNKPNISYSILLLIFTNLSKYEAYVLPYNAIQYSK